MLKLKLLVLPVLAACTAAILATIAVNEVLIRPFFPDTYHTKLWVGAAVVFAVLGVYFFLKGRFKFFVSYWSSVDPVWQLYGVCMFFVLFVTAGWQGYQKKTGAQLLYVEDVSEVVTLDKPQNLVIKSVYFDKAATGVSRPVHTQHSKNHQRTADDLAVTFTCPVSKSVADTALPGKIWLHIQFFEKYDRPLNEIEADTLLTRFVKNAVDSFLREDGAGTQFFHYFPYDSAPEALKAAVIKSPEGVSNPPAGFIAIHKTPFDEVASAELRQMLLILCFPLAILLFVLMMTGVDQRAVAEAMEGMG
ncbi:MAG: hypothetical protein JNJ57_12715 [Saprospiraceae bacterium]|nr:hypothetical protein [Saprospiraceae bacterium]